MVKSSLSQKVKELRIKQNLSQESLSTLSGLSLRTIQRIEKDEVTPTADSISRLSEALKEDITGSLLESNQNKQQSLKTIYLSSLSFVVFPLLSVIVPLVVWIWRKNQLKGNEMNLKSFIKFQLIWNIIFFLTPFILMPLIYRVFEILLTVIGGLIDINQHVHLGSWDYIPVWGILYLYNIYIITNKSWLVDQQIDRKFSPKTP